MTLKATKDANSHTLNLDAGSSKDKAKRLIINQEGSLRLGATKNAAFNGNLKVPFMVSGDEYDIIYLTVPKDPVQLLHKLWKP